MPRGAGSVERLSNGQLRIVVPAEQPVAVVLDRAFLFRIVDAESGAALFVGRVMDPTA